MTSKEIKDFATRVNNDAQFAGKTVLVKAPADMGGKYLSHRGAFDSDREDACRFDYDRDRIGDQFHQCEERDTPIEVELAD